MARIIRVVAVACVVLFGVSCAIIKEQNIYTDGGKAKGIHKREHARKCKRAEIDPYSASAGDFLDLDLEQLEKEAREAYHAQKYEEAAVLYLKYLRRNITDGGNIYNLACCFGLLGKPRLAAKYLERAYKAGFTDVGWMKKDPDFEKVRGNEQFDAMIACLEAQAKRKAEGKGKAIYISALAQFRCRLRFPKGYDAAKTYPLVVGLHGYGSDPESFVGLWNRFDNPQFIYAVPQAPYPYLRGNEQGYSWIARLPEEDAASDRSKLESEEYVARLVRHLKAEYKIGETYLLGFSQGCGMTYATGIKNHELFKGLICFGGWFPKRWLVERAGVNLDEMNGLRVFIAHGSKDTVVKPAEALKAKEILEEHGYDVTLYEFDGGHRVPKEALHKAQKWMRQEPQETKRG